VTDSTPETEAGRQAAEDKKAAAERIRQQAADDQAEAERKRQQTAAARAASRARAEQRRSAEAEQLPDVDHDAPAAAPGCEDCRQMQEITLERLGRLETQVQAIGKVVVAGAVAAVVIYFLAGRERNAQAQLAAAEPAE
jgi:hypothetical protein